MHGGGRTRKELGYQRSPYPPALAQYDGSMSKTNKVAPQHHVEELADQEIFHIISRTNSSWILDRMALLQQMRNIPATFGEVRDQVLNRVIEIGMKYDAKHIYFVTDCYHPKDHPKAHGAQLMWITRSEQQTPKQFKKYLSCGKNKE